MPGPVGSSNPFSNIPLQPQGNLTPAEVQALKDVNTLLPFGADLKNAIAAGDFVKAKEILNKMSAIIAELHLIRGLPSGIQTLVDHAVATFRSMRGNVEECTGGNADSFLADLHKIHDLIMNL